MSIEPTPSHPPQQETFTTKESNEKTLHFSREKFCLNFSKAKNLDPKLVSIVLTEILEGEAKSIAEIKTRILVDYPLKAKELREIELRPNPLTEFNKIRTEIKIALKSLSEWVKSQKNRDTLEMKEFKSSNIVLLKDLQYTPNEETPHHLIKERISSFLVMLKGFISIYDTPSLEERDAINALKSHIKALERLEKEE